MATLRTPAATAALATLTLGNSLTAAAPAAAGGISDFLSPERLSSSPRCGEQARADVLHLAQPAGRGSRCRAVMAERHLVALSHDASRKEPGMFTENQFCAAAKVAAQTYKTAGLGRTCQDEDAFSDTHIDLAWKVYHGGIEAFQQLGDRFEGLLIGGLRNEKDLVSQGAGITKELKGAFLVMNETTRKYGGAILDTGNWSVLVNDSWLLAGVHQQRAFYLASDRRRDNLWDDQNNRIRVFTRELVGLNAFGYQFVQHDYPALGEVMTCRRQGATNVDFLAYQGKIAESERTNAWKCLVKEPTPA
ncbi:hypothetical protein [Streptomyces cinereoruber]|uniref:hypothetical protein n=1 Tax=Streptomyces cinereoruber TaxID=67260 RepID=UPI00364108FA